MAPWAAYPQMQETLTLSTQMTEITLPHAQDMLPPALNALRRGETSFYFCFVLDTFQVVGGSDAFDDRATFGKGVVQ